MLLLERGKNIEHIKDYVNAHKGPWEYPHRGGRTYAMEEAYRVLQARLPAQREEPRLVGQREGVAVHRGQALRLVSRLSRRRTLAACGAGRAIAGATSTSKRTRAKASRVDWPIRYAELAPWYDYVERHAGIAGSIEGMPQLPDGQFQPAMPLNCGEELVAGRVRGLFDGRRRIIPGRVANLTQPLPGRSPCQYRNACWLGCPYGAYFSTQSSTLPAAMATGRLTLKPFSIAAEVLYDRDRQARDRRARASTRVTNQIDGVHGEASCSSARRR